jgi:peptidoglycan/xylan/chitin deacetylase (PgdA/CDA1 family)
VTPEHFAEHLDVLRQQHLAVPLQNLSAAVRTGKHLPQAIAVTFDDGYADNLHNARPLLERYDVGATVFVASGGIGNVREFWWDELERLLLQPGKLPQTVCLEFNDRVFEANLGESVRYSGDEYRCYRGWRCGSSAPTLRHSLYYSLWTLLRFLETAERHNVLDQLITWAGEDSVSRSRHRTLSAAEIVTLQSGGLVEIGAHTVTHPFLTTFSEHRQRDEIHRSKADLESIVGSPIVSFAYPHGDYTTATVSTVRRAGYSCACSTTMESVRRGTDNLQLPRIQVKDCDGEEFARKLSEWFRC